MGTLVNAENIRGVYYTEGKDVVAVDNVSIKIEEGEVLGLAGESGSGKTTLSRMILNLVPPTRGAIRFRGFDVTHPRGRSARKLFSVA